MRKIIDKLFLGVVHSRGERLIKKFQKIVVQINAKEPSLKILNDDDLRAQTEILKNRHAQGTALDDLLVDAFALVREASVRVLGLRHYDVQLIGGIALHRGKIAEMGTGEGKTLVATLPAYLNALGGAGVHIVTVNDYLAKRDAEWMGNIFRFLGLTVGAIVADLPPTERRAAYECDITYATNNELGFDYLRDNMAFKIEQKVQRGAHFAIVDEVDSILIDEARTPLIISGPADDYAHLYQTINHIIPQFSEQKESVDKNQQTVVEVAGDYILDEKHKQVFLTDDGHAKAEKLLVQKGILSANTNLYDAQNVWLMQHLNSALRAHILFRRDVDYIIRDDEVVIVDEFTGRATPGRRWSEGLHQAIEAKEGVHIKKENQTLASITFQNYFRLYQRLSGMTGTAATEAVEFQNIYGLEVVVVPPNKSSERIDYSDLVYLSEGEKFDAIVDDIVRCRAKKQPVLVGTGSIENSEKISQALTKNKIPHQVLNAKHHEQEAQIVADAGAPEAVTIATNMAGRGTDIVLGGKLSQDAEAAEKTKWQERHEMVINAGGLHIIGTERNESRRVDNQLRGRSGRQGDVGSTRFFLSLEDNLMRIFASEKMAQMMQKMGMKKGEAIEHKMVNRAIENAQKKVESMNYDARKHLLEFDDVANDQRKIIYQLRDELMRAENLQSRFVEIREIVIRALFDDYIAPQIPEEDWDVEGLQNALKSDYALDIPVQKWLDDGLEVEALFARILKTMETVAQEKENLVGEAAMRHFEKVVMLQTLDHFWKEHLSAMDYLRHSINLRGYAQKNPVQEYKRESFEMFESLLDTINIETTKTLAVVSVDAEAVAKNDKKTVEKNITYRHESRDILHQNPSFQNSQNSQNSKMAAAAKIQTYERSEKKVGRNAPCPCGSGKKFKHCHGR